MPLDVYTIRQLHFNCLLKCQIPLKFNCDTNKVRFGIKTRQINNKMQDIVKNMTNLRGSDIKKSYVHEKVSFFSLYFLVQISMAESTIISSF